MLQEKFPAVPAGTGTRPAGVTAIAVAGFASIPLFPIEIHLQLGRALPRWKLATERSEMVICVVLAIGLWRLREWARVISEIVSFLAPIGMLPCLLRPSSHKPLLVAIGIASLTYSFWSIWYLRRLDVVHAFEVQEYRALRAN